MNAIYVVVESLNRLNTRNYEKTSLFNYRNVLVRLRCAEYENKRCSGVDKQINHHMFDHIPMHRVKKENLFFYFCLLNM